MTQRSLIRAGTVATVTATLSILALKLAAPAAATDVTFSVNPGTLSITVPTDTVNLGTVDSSLDDQVVSGSLGSVTVTDTRGGRDSTWAAMVSSTDFTAGRDVVPASNVDYHGKLSGWGGPGTSGATVKAIEVDDISTPKAAVAASELHGNNSTTWSAAIDIHVPATTSRGVYLGSITHSFA